MLISVLPRLVSLTRLVRLEQRIQRKLSTQKSYNRKHLAQDHKETSNNYGASSKKYQSCKQQKKHQKNKQISNKKRNRFCYRLASTIPPSKFNGITVKSCTVAYRIWMKSLIEPMETQSFGYSSRLVNKYLSVYSLK